MLAEDLVRSVPLNSFCAGIPGGDSSFRIEHEDCIVYGAFHQEAKSLFAMAQGRLRLLALGDVPHHCQDGTAALDRAEHDVDGKLRSVFAEAIEFEAGPHGTHNRLGHISTATLRMPCAKSLGDENFYDVSDQLALVVSEKPFCCRTGRRDMAIDGGNNDCIRRSQKKLLEQRVRMFRSVLSIQ